MYIRLHNFAIPYVRCVAPLSVPWYIASIIIAGLDAADVDSADKSLFSWPFQAEHHARMPQVIRSASVADSRNIPGRCGASYPDRMPSRKSSRSGLDTRRAPGVRMVMCLFRVVVHHLQPARCECRAPDEQYSHLVRQALQPKVDSQQQQFLEVSLHDDLGTGVVAFQVILHDEGR